MGRTSLFAGCIALLTSTVAGGAQAADYGAPGPLQVTTANLPANEGGASGGYVVVPVGSGPYPLVVASHGWSASADQQVGWAKQFASWGMVVVAPSFPNTLTPNDQTDAQIIESLATLYADPSHASPAQGKVDGTRIGLEGHSAGGLATTIAAASIHPRAVVLFDPVDSSSDGENALPKICGPLLGVFANPSSCNNQEGWWPYANTTAGPEVLFHVVGSTHCDGENASRALCGSVCGGAADATRQTEYARYATAFLLAHLAGDAAAASTLTMSALSADGAIASVIVKGGPDCTSLEDGGAPVEDGGAGAGAGADDASAPADDAAFPEPSADAGGAPPPGASAGSSGESPPPGVQADPGSAGGCACTSATASPARERGSIALIVALGLAALCRRRGGAAA